MTDEELNEAVKTLLALKAVPVGMSPRHWRLFHAILNAVDTRGFGDRPPAVADKELDRYPVHGHGNVHDNTEKLFGEAKKIADALRSPARRALAAIRAAKGTPNRPKVSKQVAGELRNLGLIDAGDEPTLTDLGGRVIAIADPVLK